MKRLFGSLTGQSRYVCVDCQYRGWVSRDVSRHHGDDDGHDAPNVPALPGRPLEARDFRAARDARLRTVGLVLAAMLVGGILAVMVTRLL